MWRTGKARVRVLSTATLLAVVCLRPGQAADALQFYKNYLVTGDYVVSGVGLAGKGIGGLATGTIDVGGVPVGADVVAAFLYWETVESTAAPSSTNGFFGSATGSVYPIAAKTVGIQTPPCWSTGGATGSSQGTVTLRVYRADVRPYLPIVNGRAQGNGLFTVILPDSGSAGKKTPMTEGASLVIVYRVLSPAYPLKAVVIYDGSWTMNTTNPFMTRPIQGFYQAVASAAPSSARLTHIVANGQSNFSEQMTFQGGTAASFSVTNPFTSAQGANWDNPTFDVSGYVADNASTVSTQVLPIGSNFDCLSWGAIVFSTLVKDSDGDGLLDVWETDQGYNSVPDGTWVPLPGAINGVKDIYVQMDYLKKTGAGAHSHALKQAAADMVGDAFKAQGYQLHIDFGNNYPGDPYFVPYSATSAGGNAIDEDLQVTCHDTVSKLCEFPEDPGVIPWKGSFMALKNQYLPQPRRHSYRWVVMGHTLGLETTSWSVALHTLVSIVNNGTTATVTTAAPHGLAAGARTTVQGALADFDLNGTYFVQTVLSATTFTINTANVTDGTYNNYGLAVASGSSKSTSGWADIGGPHAIVTLGSWRSDIPGDDQTGSVQVQAGTFMHELGHMLGLTHGGTYGLTYGPNCKANFQSVMNYPFQIRGLMAYDGSVHVGYSGQVLPDLFEGGLSEPAGLGASTPYQTRWYAPLSNSFLDRQLHTVANRAATRHCDGTPLSAAEVGTMVRVDGPLAPGPIDWNDDGSATATGVLQDTNFNGALPDSTFKGFNDWANVDLRQIGGGRNALGFSLDVGPGDVPGNGGGDALGGGGGDALGGGGGDALGGGGGDALGGGGGEELNDFDLANSTVDPPANFTAVHPAGAHFVNTSWNLPAFGRIRTAYVWRANTTNGPISPTNLPVVIKTLTGTPPGTAYQDPNVKNNNTYTYFVTVALGADGGPNSGNQSGPSNMVSVTVKF